MDIIKKIQSVLKNRIPYEIDNSSGELIHSSVLIPIFESTDGYKVLFTERTYKVEHHKGQISFPGGAVDPEDKDFKETALREAFEEIGLQNKDVEILGRLDDQLTIASSYLIHPFVGKIPYPYDFKSSRDEVERIIPVPLELFCEGDSDRHLSSIETETFNYQGPAYKYNGVTIWGATAKIMNKFMQLLNEN